MAEPAPDHLPLMPIGCWAVPLGLAGAALVVERSDDPGWWMLSLGVVFGLFTLAYAERAIGARRNGRPAGGQWKRAMLAGAVAALFIALHAIGR
ncbi:hypothetical protein [Sphingomicrobium astaxanthinifaciens]|uniref:hypothetical protein n=1 Tax=Sphingomicrobium astaxanthinifaciens TaxID=1227949 RepID=UPI001FCB1941|nr:hypothetical protein [Sphingomicrobium astaxanthinifaciens]MCJ7421818.1 hypothetical protein [Sphingomicrobium astaxanthinifaciens]